MTQGQQVFADGFASLLSVHGQIWTRTSDSKTVTGIPRRLDKEITHLALGQDREIAVLVAGVTLSPIVPATQVMPSPALKQGDELTKNSKTFRVVRSDFQESNALWLVILSPTF